MLAGFIKFFTCQHSETLSELHLYPLAGTVEN